jgi:hypothetical protein
MKSNPISNFLTKISKSLKSKKSNRKHRRKSSKKSQKCKRTTQKGGVGFKYDLSSCSIGGRPEVVPTSDCPPGVGPGSADFANAVYNMKGGAKRKNRTCKRKTRPCNRGSRK